MLQLEEMSHFVDRMFEGLGLLGWMFVVSDS
jgi:hypothetical protein